MTASSDPIPTPRASSNGFEFTPSLIPSSAASRTPATPEIRAFVRRKQSTISD